MLILLALAQKITHAAGPRDCVAAQASCCCGGGGPRRLPRACSRGGRRQGSGPWVEAPPRRGRVRKRDGAGRRRCDFPLPPLFRSDVFGGSAQPGTHPLPHYRTVTCGDALMTKWAYVVVVSLSTSSRRFDGTVFTHPVCPPFNATMQTESRHSARRAQPRGHRGRGASRCLRRIHARPCVLHACNQNTAVVDFGE